MGGGYVSKNQFIYEGGPMAGKMVHYFNIEGFPLCAGTPPIYHSVLDQLKNDNVGLIITLLLDPLHSGRTISHVPFDFDETEWTDGDIGIEETIKKLNIELLHIPVNDACPPTNESIDKLIMGVRDFIARRPNEKIYIHCWRGAGRTSVLLISLLVSIWNVQSEQAIGLVRRSNNRYKISQFQIPYLNVTQNTDFPHLASSLYKDIYDPIIRTPGDNKCWIIKK
jgi:hypothetical protein